MDLKAIIMRKLFYWQICFNKNCSTFIAKIKFVLWGIPYGKAIRVFGKLIVYRAPKSIILIGNHCTFNSSSKFNFRGINHPCIIQTGSSEAKIVIRDYVGMSGVSIVSNNSVTIGNHVLIGANCIIGDRDDHPDRYASPSMPIEIHDYVWLGMNVTVLKGVTIGEHSIIGANSVVTKDIPPYCIAAGNPCRTIKFIDKSN